MDLERVLEQDWRVYREQQLKWLAAPSVAVPLPREVAEFIGPFDDDPGAPFDRWPGLAPGADRAVDDPDAVARRVFAQWAADHPYPVSGCHLALVAANRSADVPAAMGWDADAPLALLCSLLRSGSLRTTGSATVDRRATALGVSTAAGTFRYALAVRATARALLAAHIITTHIAVAQ
ncbi:hypothetical protein ACIBCO_25545 [Streptomyces violascens]|uniref:hypothetical protein n=1 Tax=Streptomyces violascens TaxID=67381 RepID=UPI0037BBEDAE